MAEWTGRLSRPAPDRYTVVADLDGAVVGFAHTILDADPTWGACLDNLHVRHDLKRHGIGARLMAETVRAVARRRPSTGLYLLTLSREDGLHELRVRMQPGSEITGHGIGVKGHGPGARP